MLFCMARDVQSANIMREEEDDEKKKQELDTVSNKDESQDKKMNKQLDKIPEEIPQSQVLENKI